MRLLALGLVITAAACGSKSSSGIDAPVIESDAPGTGIDGPAGIVDAPGTGVDAANASAADCMSYCTTIQAACTGTHVQYTSSATCVASCLHYPAGTASANSGSSLACRATHALLAQGDPNTHCVHAGPSGGGTCGATCEGYCAIAAAVCPTENPPATCAADCAAISTTPPYTSTIANGDSIECRLHFATLASTDPATNCVETGQNGTQCQ